MVSIKIGNSTYDINRTLLWGLTFRFSTYNINDAYRTLPNYKKYLPSLLEAYAYSKENFDYQDHDSIMEFFRNKENHFDILELTGYPFIEWCTENNIVIETSTILRVVAQTYNIDLFKYIWNVKYRATFDDLMYILHSEKSYILRKFVRNGSQVTRRILCRKFGYEFLSMIFDSMTEIEQKKVEDRIEQIVNTVSTKHLYYLCKHETIKGWICTLSESQDTEKKAVLDWLCSK
jgi:hypothetical protein